LYEKACSEPVDSLRFEMYRHMDKLIVTDAPIVPLWYDMVIHLVQPGVKGFKPNALNLLELKKTMLR
jgi:peptide/nickel transport system substrate-binding protein